MNVNLTPEIEELQTGRYRSSSEVVGEALWPGVEVERSNAKMSGTY